MGFDYLYGFLGGETDQWTPYLFRNNKQLEPARDPAQQQAMAAKND